MASPLDVSGLFNAFQSRMYELGVFASVDTHEPKAAPGKERRVAIWFEATRPAPAGSGLVSTTAVVVFTIRLYSNMLAEPQDEIDPGVLRAVDRVMSALHGDFEMGGIARNIDVLGQFGPPLQARAGYINQDGTLYRVVDIEVPVVVNDLWDQVP